MTPDLEIGLYIFMLAAFLGYHLISRVPPLLHTPLMSATNAMSGISLIGSLVVAGANYGALSTLFGFIAVTCSSTNVVGGFLITDRMLRMFKSEHDGASGVGRSYGRKVLAGAVLSATLLLLYGLVLRRDSNGTIDTTQALKFFYIVSAALFILGLKGLSSPKFARKGMFLAEFGMGLAVVGTLFHHDIVTYRWIVAGLAIGSVVGGGMGLWIPMTAVPQRTALSHSLGALAATLIGISEYVRQAGGLDKVLMTAIGLEVVIGGLTVTG
ncbi:MAG TPA: proton-translocating transhydrogenase family protein, partial [Candidatus Acidoferrales bacterium]|nr:proton-translocating transhydrogenase family protein [Candidatus Acidoferrales bacterium]